MRILQIHNRHHYAGGEDAVVADEASVLAEAGHSVKQLITSNPDGVVRAGAALLFSPWNPLTSRTIARFIEETRPGIAHVHNTWFALTPSILSALSRRGVPVIMTLHNYRLTCANALLFRDGGPCQVCVEGSAWNAVRYGCYRGSRMASLPASATIYLNQRLGTWIHHVSTFIALTEFQRQIMIRAGIPAESIVVKPNFADDPGNRTNKPSESNVVLFAGRLSEEKGVRLLLDAWREAPTDGLTLIAAGEGPDSQALAKDLPSGVKLCGRLSSEKLMKLMLEARAMIIPSLWYEGFPRVLAEAFAAGLPTLVPEQGGPGEIVTETLGLQWVFRMGDKSDLQRGLNEIRNGEACNDSGRIARRAYEEEFSRELAAGRLIRIYEDCLTAHRTEGTPIPPDSRP